MSSPPQVIIVMGVAGSGKSTVGSRLAAALGWAFYDGDDYHPVENVAKMASGIPLTDADRLPWLRRLHDLIHEQLQRGESAVVACSALKAAYRDLLIAGNPGIRFVYLRATPDLIRQRLQNRTGHFMKAGMVDSQFAALEEPADAMTVDAGLVPEEIVMHLLRHMNL